MIPMLRCFISCLMMVLVFTASIHASSVFVAPGEYNQRLIIAKPINLVGVGEPGKLVVVRPLLTDDIYDFLFGEGANGSTIDGFTLDFSGEDGSRGGPFTGIKISHVDGPAVTDVIIQGCTITAGKGSGSIGLETGVNADVGNLLIQNNYFIGTEDGGEGSMGIVINPRTGVENITILNNEFTGRLHTGIAVDSRNVILQGNTIVDTIDMGDNAGILIYSSNDGIEYDTIQLIGNDIRNMYIGVNVGLDSTRHTALNAIISDNVIQNNHYVGIYARAGAKLKVTSNTLMGNYSNARDNSEAASIWESNTWGDFANNSGHPEEYLIPGTAGSKDISPVGGYRITAWPNASAITHGQSLSQSNLSGGNTSIHGTFAFVNPNAILNIGTHDVDVRFTPSDRVTYSPTVGTVEVTVNEAQIATPTYTQVPTEPSSTPTHTPSPDLEATPTATIEPTNTPVSLPSIVSVSVQPEGHVPGAAQSITVTITTDQSNFNLVGGATATFFTYGVNSVNSTSGNIENGIAVLTLSAAIAEGLTPNVVYSVSAIISDGDFRDEYISEEIYTVSASPEPTVTATPVIPEPTVKVPPAPTATYQPVSPSNTPVTSVDPTATFPPVIPSYTPIPLEPTATQRPTGTPTPTNTPLSPLTTATILPTFTPGQPTNTPTPPTVTPIVTVTPATPQPPLPPPPRPTTTPTIARITPTTTPEAPSTTPTAVSTPVVSPTITPTATRLPMATPMPTLTPTATSIPVTMPTPFPDITLVWAEVDERGILSARWEYAAEPDHFVVHLYRNHVYVQQWSINGAARETFYSLANAAEYRVFVAAVVGERRTRFVSSNIVQWSGYVPTPLIPIDIPTPTPTATELPVEPSPTQQPGILVVSVHDTGSSSEDISGSIVENHENARELAIRWRSTIEEPAMDYHIYVSINDSDTFQFLGQTRSGASTQFVWNDLPPHANTASGFRSGPQFGNSYFFRVYPIIEETGRATMGYFNAAGAVYYQESDEGVIPPGRLVVTVTDSLFTFEDVSGGVVENVEEDRSLVVRWTSTIEVELHDFHVYVQVDDSSYAYLGRAGSGEAAYLNWRAGSMRIAPAFRDGPQFGDSYRFRVYPILEESKKAELGFFENRAPVKFVEGDVLSLNASVIVNLDADSNEDLSGSEAYVADTDRRLFIHWDFVPPLPDIVDYHIYIQDEDESDNFNFLGSTASGEASTLRWAPGATGIDPSRQRGPEFDHPYRFQVFPIGPPPEVAPFGSFYSGDSIVLRDAGFELELGEVIVTADANSYRDISGMFVRQSEEDIGLTVRWNLLDEDTAGFNLYAFADWNEAVLIAELDDPFATYYIWTPDNDLLQPTFGGAYSFLVTSVDTVGLETNAVHSGAPVRILFESQTPVGGVIVSDNLISMGPLPENRDVDAEDDRQLVIRWNLELEPNLLIHVYVNVNDSDWRYLGQAFGDRQDYFEWRPRLPQSVLSAEFVDGPQGGDTYQFMVYALYGDGIMGPARSPIIEYETD